MNNHYTAASERRGGVREVSDAALDLAEAIAKIRVFDEKNRQWLNTSPEVLLMMRSTYRRLIESASVSNFTGGPSNLTFPANFYGIKIEVFDDKRYMKLRAVELWNTGMKVVIVTEEQPAETAGEE